MTKEICEQLVKEHPDKIRYFEYPYQIAGAWTAEHQETDERSVHNLAYFYNRCFAQASYSHVGKIDDDDLMVADRVDMDMARDQILQLDQHKFFAYSGYNVIRSWDQYMTLKWPNRYAGFIWDHGYYLQDETTFYYKWNDCEKFAKDHKMIVRHGFWYIHLKYLKKQYMPDGDTFVHPQHHGFKVKTKYDIFIDQYLQKKLWKKLEQ